MKNCNEFDPSMVEAIEAYPLVSLPAETFAYEHRSSITTDELDVFSLSSNKLIVPKSDKPTFSDSTEMTRPGRIYSITIEVPCLNPSDDELSVIEQLEQTPHVFLIKCFPDVNFIVIPSVESYAVVHNLKDGTGSIHVSCKNMSGIIPYIKVR